jgi:hypothetical protein
MQLQVFVPAKCMAVRLPTQQHTVTANRSAGGTSWIKSTLFDACFSGLNCSVKAAPIVFYL